MCVCDFDKITSIILEKVYHYKMETMRKPHSAFFLGGTCNVMGGGGSMGRYEHTNQFE